MQTGAATLEDSLAVNQSHIGNGINLPYDPAITPLAIYPSELKSVFTQKLVYKCLQQFYS